MVDSSIRAGNTFGGEFIIVRVAVIQLCGQGSDGTVAHQSDCLLLFLFHKIGPPVCFLQSSCRRERCQVRLCWQDKKKIFVDFNLQERSGKAPEAAAYQQREWEQEDAMCQEAVPNLNGTQISPMPDQAGTMAAGAGKLVELDGADHFIIKILEKRVVKFVLNGYHNRCPCGASRRWFWVGTKLWSVRFLPISMLQRDVIP